MIVSGIRAPLESRVLHINGTAIHVVVAGPAEGRPITFIHGFPEFWFAWRRQIDYFVSSGYRVIIPDLRGYNLSDKPAGVTNYSIDVLAGDILGVLGALAIPQTFVVGHDWGAAVTWHLAAHFPNRIRRAAMLSVPHPRVFIKHLFRNPAQLRKSWYIFLFQLPWLPEFLLRSRDWALLVQVLQDTSVAGVFSESDLEQYKESWAKDGAVTAMLNSYRGAMLRPSKWARHSEASRVRVPALLIWGKDDQFAVEAMAKESLRYCDDGHVEIFENASHWVQHEHPEKLNKLLLKFFA